MALTKREIEIVSMACEYMSEIEQQAFLNDVFNMRKSAGAQDEGEKIIVQPYCDDGSWRFKEIKYGTINSPSTGDDAIYLKDMPLITTGSLTVKSTEVPEITGPSYPYPYHIRKAHDKQDTEFVEYSSTHPTGLRRYKEVEF